MMLIVLFDNPKKVRSEEVDHTERDLYIAKLEDCAATCFSKPKKFIKDEAIYVYETLREDTRKQLMPIILAESGFDNGAINTEGNSAGKDGGFCQINDHYNPAVKDVSTKEEHLKLCEKIYDESGTKPWNSSKKRWIVILDHINKETV